MRAHARPITPIILMYIYVLLFDERGYRRGEEPEEEVGVVLVADREVTGIADHPLRPEHVGHLGQLLGPEYLPVAQVRREQQRLRGRMGRRGLGIPQRVRAAQVQRRGLGRQARGPPPHVAPGGATHEYTERGAHGATGRTGAGRRGPRGGRAADGAALVPRSRGARLPGRARDVCGGDGRTLYSSHHPSCTNTATPRMYNTIYH